MPSTTLNKRQPPTTWRCSMTTTTCRCLPLPRFPASSIRPCSARPGWLPRP
ncbi:hypothetical protein M8494_23065 [Serratia ureilytica]